MAVKTVAKAALRGSKKASKARKGSSRGRGGIFGGLAKFGGFVSDRQRRFVMALLAAKRKGSKSLSRSQFGKGAKIKREQLRRGRKSLTTAAERKSKVKLTRGERFQRALGAAAVSAGDFVTRPENIVRSVLSAPSLRILSTAGLTGIITGSVVEAGRSGQGQSKAEVRRAVRTKIRNRLTEQEMRRRGFEGKRLRDLTQKQRRDVRSTVRRQEKRLFAASDKAVDTVFKRKQLQSERSRKRPVGRPRNPRSPGRPKNKRPVGRPKGS